MSKNDEYVSHITMEIVDLNPDQHKERHTAILQDIDRLKDENRQLKELLKECREASLDYGNHSGNYELYDRIDNAIGEKK